MVLRTGTRLVPPTKVNTDGFAVADEPWVNLVLQCTQVMATDRIDRYVCECRVVCYSRTECYVVFFLIVVCSLGICSLAPNLQWPFNVIGECCALIALLSVVMATSWVFGGLVGRPDTLQTESKEILNRTITAKTAVW